MRAAVVLLVACGSMPDVAIDARPVTPQLVLEREALAPADLGVLVNADDPQSVLSVRTTRRRAGFPREHDLAVARRELLKSEAYHRLAAP